MTPVDIARATNKKSNDIATKTGAQPENVAMIPGGIATGNDIWQRTRSAFNVSRKARQDQPL